MSHNGIVGKVSSSNHLLPVAEIFPLMLTLCSFLLNLSKFKWIHAFSPIISFHSFLMLPFALGVLSFPTDVIGSGR